MCTCARLVKCSCGPVWCWPAWLLASVPAGQRACGPACLRASVPAGQRACESACLRASVAAGPVWLRASMAAGQCGCGPAWLGASVAGSESLVPARTPGSGGAADQLRRGSCGGPGWRARLSRGGAACEPRRRRRQCVCTRASAIRGGPRGRWNRGQGPQLGLLRGASRHRCTGYFSQIHRDALRTGFCADAILLPCLGTACPSAVPCTTGGSRPGTGHDPAGSPAAGPAAGHEQLHDWRAGPVDCRVGFTHSATCNCAHSSTRMDT